MAKSLLLDPINKAGTYLSVITAFTLPALFSNGNRTSKCRSSHMVFPARAFVSFEYFKAGCHGGLSRRLFARL